MARKRGRLARDLRASARKVESRSTEAEPRPGAVLTVKRRGTGYKYGAGTGPIAVGTRYTLQKILTAVGNRKVYKLKGQDGEIYHIAALLFGYRESRSTELTNPRSSALRLLKDAQRGVLQVISGAQRLDHGSDRTAKANWDAAENALQEAQKKIKYAISQLA